jgi:hypothetical protein
MRVLQQVMFDYNAYTPIYRHAYEILQMYNVPDYTANLCVVPGNDPRRYNLPTADEVGVILPERNDFQGDFRDIIIHLRPQHYLNIYDMYNYNVLTKVMPCMFPYIMFFSSPMASLVGIMNCEFQVIQDV